MDHRSSRVFVGIAFTLAFVLITAVFSVIGNASSANAALNGRSNSSGAAKKKVQGSVKLSLAGGNTNAVKDSLGAASETLSITFNLKNIPPGQHASDLHQGNCPLTFLLQDGSAAPLGPFSSGVTLPLGEIRANAGGVFSKTLTFQVGGNTGIPTDLLSSGKWFFCIHTGSLSTVLNAGPTAADKFNALQKFLQTKKGPGQVKQIACLALSDGKLANNVLSLSVDGVKVNASA